MEIIDKIKAEIDRQLKELGMSGSVCVGRSVLLEMRDFVNSLEKESDLTTTEEVTLGAIARHLIAIKDHIEDARLDDEELEVLRKIGYPERYGIQATPKIKGWVARGRDDELSFFTEKPRRLTTCWIGNGFCDAMILMEKFPNLKWEDDPIEVELVIKRV